MGCQAHFPGFAPQQIGSQPEENAGMARGLCETLLPIAPLELYKFEFVLKSRSEGQPERQ